MGVSLALNAVLALAVVLLLSDPGAHASNMGLCRGTPTVMADAEVAHTGKVRYEARTEVARPSNFMRKAASPTTSGKTISAVNYIRCQPS
jgi:hypothetical protein